MHTTGADGTLRHRPNRSHFVANKAIHYVGFASVGHAHHRDLEKPLLFRSHILFWVVR